MSFHFDTKNGQRKRYFYDVMYFSRDNLHIVVSLIHRKRDSPAREDSSARTTG